MSLKNPRLSEQAAQEKDTDFWRVYNTVRDMAEKHRCRATDKMKEWEFMTFLCEIYRAGYAEGKEGTGTQYPEGHMMGKTFTFTDPNIIELAEALSDPRLSGRIRSSVATEDIKEAASDKNKLPVNLFVSEGHDENELFYVVRRNRKHTNLIHKLMIFATSMENAFFGKQTVKQ